jgi:hypothetical protein
VAGSKTKQSVAIDPWTGEARKPRIETKKAADAKKATLQDKAGVRDGPSADVSSCVACGGRLLTFVLGRVLRLFCLLMHACCPLMHACCFLMHACTWIFLPSVRRGWGFVGLDCNAYPLPDPIFLCLVFRCAISRRSCETLAQHRLLLSF